MARLPEGVRRGPGRPRGQRARPFRGRELRDLRQGRRRDLIPTGGDRAGPAAYRQGRRGDRRGSRCRCADPRNPPEFRRLTPGPGAARPAARSRCWPGAASGRPRRLGPPPDQVTVAFGLDPARSLAWTWRTGPGRRLDRASAGPGRPAGIGADALADAADHPRATRTWSTPPDLLNDPSIRRHRAAATDLTPDTAYAYSLGDGSPEGWSPWRTVRTGPARPRSFRFLYLGDPQCGLEDWGKLLAAATGGIPDAAFLLIAGDLVDRGNERTNWDHFFLRAAGVFEALPADALRRQPRIPRPGPAALSARSSTCPGTAPRGSIRTSSTRSSTPTPSSRCSTARWRSSTPAMARTQAEWLDAALGRTRAAWKFVMFHHPVYASHPTRESPALRRGLGPRLRQASRRPRAPGARPRLPADLPAARQPPGRDRRSRGRPTSSPSRGPSTATRRPRAETAVGFTNLSTYQTIDIQVPENRLIYRAWDVEGREVDRLTIEKSTQVVRHGHPETGPGLRD